MSFSAVGDGADRLALVAADHPDKIAIVDDRPGEPTRSVTFRELNERVNRIAHALIDLGFDAGERLVWAGRSSIDAIAIQHAVRKVGGYSIALNHGLTRNEVHAIARVAEASFVWSEASFREMFDGSLPPSIRCAIVFEGEPLEGQLAADELLAGRSAEEPPPRVRNERAFDPILSFTSGTTGLPKGVVRHTLGSEEMRLQSRLLGDGRGTFMVTGSLSHSGPNGFANNSLTLGDSVVLQRRFDPEDWLRLVATHRATTSYSAPYMMRRVCALPDRVRAAYDTSCLRTMIAAAAQWPFELKQAFLAAFPGCDLWEIYGSTELGSVTVLEPTDQLRKPGSCGRPVPGVEIRLIAADGSVIEEPDTPGLLYARGDCVFQGYLGDPGGFESARRGDFLTTFDVASFDDEGFYSIRDRQKDMVISGGINVYPREIENVIERRSDVLECAVIGRPDEEWGERLHAFVVPQGKKSPTAFEIEGWCREYLARHKVPRSVEIVDGLPHVLSGKIDKKALRKRLAERT